MKTTLEIHTKTTFVHGHTIAFEMDELAQNRSGIYAQGDVAKNELGFENVILAPHVQHRFIRDLVLRFNVALVFVCPDI